MSVYLFFHLNCGSVPSYCVMKCLYASQQQVSLLMIFFFYHNVRDHLYILKVGGSMTLCVAKHVMSWLCSRPQVSTCLTTRFSLTTSPQQLPPVAMHSLYGFYARRAESSLLRMLRLLNFPFKQCITAKQCQLVAITRIEREGGNQPRAS